MCSTFCTQVSYLFLDKFNCLYRWHATTSREDEQWTQKVFGKFFSGKSSEEVTINDFRTAAHKAYQTQPDVKEWTFGECVLYFIVDLSAILIPALYKA